MLRLRLYAAASLALATCSREPSRPSSDLAWVPTPAPDMGAVVARVGDVPIFAAEVSAEMRRRGQSAREALATLVEFHLLAERARSAGIPAAGTAPKSLLAQRLLEREFEPATPISAVPEGELQRLYERARDAYVHPRLVEVVMLSVYTGELMKDEPRAKARETARELAEAVARRAEKTPEDLEALARDPAWASRRVVAKRVLQGPDRPFGRAVGGAVMRLRAPGDTTPLVEDATGLHMARYVGERPPKNVAFAEARPELLEKYYTRWRQVRFLEFSRRLAEGHTVEVHPARLAPAR